MSVHPGCGEGLQPGAYNGPVRLLQRQQFPGGIVECRENGSVGLRIGHAVTVHAGAVMRGIYHRGQDIDRAGQSRIILPHAFDIYIISDNGSEYVRCDDDSFFMQFF